MFPLRTSKECLFLLPGAECGDRYTARRWFGIFTTFPPPPLTSPGPGVLVPPSPAAVHTPGCRLKQPANLRSGSLCESRRTGVVLQVNVIGTRGGFEVDLAQKVNHGLGETGLRVPSGDCHTCDILQFSTKTEDLSNKQKSHQASSCII